MRNAHTQRSPIYLSTIANYVENAPLYLEHNVKFLELYKVATEHGHLDSYNIPYTTPMGIHCLRFLGLVEQPSVLSN